MSLMERSNRTIDGLIAACRAHLTRDLFLSLERLAVTIAETAAPIGALVGFLIGVVGAIKLDSFFIFVSGVVWLIVVAVSYYVGHSFIERCRRVIENSESELSASEFLDVFALLFGVGAALILGSGLFWAIEVSSFEPLKWTAPLALAALLYTTLLLNPALISTRISEGATGGQDALAISLVLYKAGVRQAGIVLGLGTLSGSALLAYSLYNLFAVNGEYALLGGFQSIAGVIVLLVALLFPFFIYLVFVFAYLVVDLCRAILTLNKKT